MAFCWLEKEFRADRRDSALRLSTVKMRSGPQIDMVNGADILFREPYSGRGADLRHTEA